MTSLKIFLLLLACLGVKFVYCGTEGNDSCYADITGPYIYTGTKTPYHFVHGLIENSSVPNCEPLQIWVLCRHGTRNPSTKEIRSMLTNLPNLQRTIIENHEKRNSGNLCEKDIDNLKAWKLDPKLTEASRKRLVKQGEIDLETLGERYKHSFPDLLKLKPSEDVADNYEFKSTNTQRTVASMHSFIKGLFGNASAANGEVIETPKDVLLMPYKTCESWSKQEKDPSTMNEVNAFINGTEFKQLIRDVSRRLGYPNNLTLDDVWLMYTTCAFEKAWLVNETSPWCAAFNENELRIFEYEDDLFTYWSTGYGMKMNSQIGCPLVKDMFDHFSKLEQGEMKQKRGTFYFSHRSTLQTFYTAMGIDKDSEPLRASNFRNMGNRKWRSSLNAPFAVNFAAVFYKCGSSHKVRFYLGEKPLEYEGCEMGICDWEFLKKKLEPTALKCSLDFCKN